MGCGCPLPVALDDITLSNCPFDLGQIQRLAVIRPANVIWDSESGGGDGLSGVPQVDSQIDTQADWEALTVAVDDTKAVFTPLIGGDPVIEAGEAITTGGGDNSTLNGVIEYNGENPDQFTAVFKSLDPKGEHAPLRNIFNCQELELYMINQDGKITAIDDGNNETRRGIRVTGRVSGRGNTGQFEKDTIAITLTLEKDWFEKVSLVTPEPGFDPLRFDQ